MNLKYLLEINTPRILSIEQIYHLEIPPENIDINLLLETINLLPELNTLKIYSVSLYERRILNNKEIILSSIEDTSQITKVDE